MQDSTPVTWVLSKVVVYCIGSDRMIGDSSSKVTLSISLAIMVDGGMVLNRVRVLVLISLHTSEITLQHLHTEYRKCLKSSTSRRILHAVYLELLDTSTSIIAHYPYRLPLPGSSAGNLTQQLHADGVDSVIPEGDTFTFPAEVGGLGGARGNFRAVNQYSTVKYK
jgi:hypothetical protein